MIGHMRSHWNLYGLVVYAAALLLLTACSQAGSPADAANKPSGPLQVSLRPVEEVVPGGVVSFEAEVMAQTVLTEVVLDVELPAPLRFVAGRRHWQGPLLPGESKIISFSVYLPEQGEHHIRVSASVPGGNGSFSSEAVFLLRDGGIEPAAGVQISPDTVPSTEKRPVREYRLK